MISFKQHESYIYKLISNEMEGLKAILGIKMIEIMEDSTNIYPE